MLDPADGGTYGCVEFPSNFASLAGIVEPNVTVKDANAIKTVMSNGNVTAAEVVDMIDLFTKSVYHSTPNVDQDIHACDVGGLAVLECEDVASPFGKTIRAATLAGVFVDAAWATNGQPLTHTQAKGFYTTQDFADMVTLGLNAVQIPFKTADFTDGKSQSLLTDILDLVEAANLDAILVLVGNDDAAIFKAAEYAASHNAVVALTLPSQEDITAARSAASTLPLMIPLPVADLNQLSLQEPNVFAAIDVNHAENVADVASSNSLNDRMKQYYHESVACAKRSPIEYSKCFKGVPVFVAHGFDLSIDDCISQDSDHFSDYGQCNRFDETIDSDWWAAHRQSFAAKQLFSYERGLGWSFAAYKLYGDDENAAVIDSPAKLLSFKNVAAAGLLSSLGDAQLACLNPPQSDFVLGDDTASPSASPPPDCGNGWWNMEKQACDYWIPPTLVPTEACPTCSECPVCPVPEPCAICPAPVTNAALAKAATGGGVLALFIGYFGLRIFGRGNGGGYSTLPS